MASEMRRAATLLVSRRPESFESRHSHAESVARLQAATTGGGALAQSLRGEVSAGAVRLLYARSISRRTRCVFEGAWKVECGAVRLEGEFVPTRPTRTFLASSSIVLTALIVASFYALLSPNQDASMKILVPVFSLFSIVAFPFVVVAMGSQREVEELGIAKAIRGALSPPEEAPPVRGAD